MPAPKSNWLPSPGWALALVAAPLVLIVIEFVRGAIHETDAIAKQTLRGEIQTLQGQALQHGEGLQTLIAAHGAAAIGWPQIRTQPWFTDYWSTIQLARGRDVYAAAVDDSGTIVMHTDPARIGKRLERGWYEKKVSDSGPDVVWTDHSAIGADRPVYDVSTPLAAGGISLGDYHQGLDSHWVAEQVGNERAGVVQRWFWVLLLILGVDSAAVGALVYLARRQRRSENTLAASQQQRARELAQLGSGLAHEVRNPLHALRINLHTLKRALSGRLLPEEQMIATIEESDGAVGRLDALMRDFLQFADPGISERENVDVIQALRTTLTLLSENLRRGQIEVRSQLPTAGASVTMSPVRLKQLLLNVMTFAQNRVGRGGRIDILASVLPGAVEITVADSGPAIDDEQETRLFEPFQAPAETGSGLGLALVRVFAEEVGGSASWEGDGTTSSRCLVRLPLAAPRSKGSSI